MKSRLALLIAVLLLFWVRGTHAEEFDGFVSDGPLILEPLVQGYIEQDYAYVYEQDGKVYVSLPQMSSYMGFKYQRSGNDVKIYWANTLGDIKFNLEDNKVTIGNIEKNIAGNDIKIIEDTVFASAEFFAKVLDTQVEVDHLNMQLKLDSSKDFPTTSKKLIANKRRSSGVYQYERDSFENYEFDERLLDYPVVDLTLGKGWSHYKGGHTDNTDAYTMNVAGIAGGLDINAYIYGDSGNDHQPQMRVKGSREFLDEPPNKLNLKKFSIGDISGVNNSYFTSYGFGRGVNMSSFKNLVMTANKTIDITGPLQTDWQVELYWNDQLLGYRQSGLNGEYAFTNIPVSYGLNTFKLVFYGPYGEVRTEYKRYYSGTSPVKKGEFGYNMAAYQPDRYLVEDNETFAYDRKSNKSVFDFTGYYGITDNLTYMGGYTQTPNLNKTDVMNFGMQGAQYAVDGVSLQYNLEQNLDTSKVGHHIEAQGDVYIGDIYAAADKYNGIHSPNSEAGGDYLDDKYEVRLSGMLPWSLPYYMSYSYGNYEDNNNDYHEISTRISKQLEDGINLSLEDNFYRYSDSGNSNEIRAGVYKWWDVLSSEAWVTYESTPRSRFKELTLRSDWRTGRRTYISGEYTRNLITDMDTVSISAGKVFNFGGLVGTMSVDRDLNTSFYLTYNISFAKTPDEWSMITNANSKFSDTGSVHVVAKDETGEPIEGLGINANGLEKEVYTNEKGQVTLVDLQPYEKVNLRIDEETLPDVALRPDTEVKKLVLRPGTIKKIELGLQHYGAVEGKLANVNDRLLFGYMISAVDKDGKEVNYTFADTEGFFILDDLPYGTYDIVISKDSNQINVIKDVKIDDVSIYIENEVSLFEAILPPEEEEDEYFDEVPEDAKSYPDYLIDESMFDEMKEDLKNLENPDNEDDEEDNIPPEQGDILGNSDHNIYIEKAKQKKNKNTLFNIKDKDTLDDVKIYIYYEDEEDGDNVQYTEAMLHNLKDFPDFLNGEGFEAEEFMKDANKIIEAH